MKINRLYSLIILITIFHFMSFSLLPSEECSKIKVGVFVNIVDEEEFFSFLDEKQASGSSFNSGAEIQDKIIKELEKNSPDIDFIKNSKDTDYRIEFELKLFGGGESHIVGNVEVSKFIGFSVGSILRQNDSCGFPGRVVYSELTDRNAPEDVRKDLLQLIKYHISLYGSISDKIKNFEREKRVPPRGPEIEYTLSRKFVSPLEEERKVEIRIKVKDCRGRDVYDKYHGQKVILPRKLKRGEIKPTKNFNQDYVVNKNTIILFIKNPKGASATYTLKRGNELDIENFKMLTCGIDKRIVKDVFIPIAGLEIKVKPAPMFVFPEENAKVKLEFIELLPNGKKEPVSGKFLQIKTEGIVDGRLEPRTKILTSNGGKAFLNYKAGLRDKSIKIRAFYKPKFFDEKVEGIGYISIKDKRYDWIGTVKIIFNESSKSDNKKNNSRETMSYEISANVWVYFLYSAKEPALILAKGVSGMAKSKIFLFTKSREAACPGPFGTGVVYKKPGGWRKTVIKSNLSLIEKNLRIYPHIGIYRIKGKYNFKFGVSGLYLKGSVLREDSEFSVCDGETKRETYGPNQMPEKPFYIENLYYEGKIGKLDILSGVKVFKPPFTKRTIEYVWYIERIKK